MFLLLSSILHYLYYILFLILLMVSPSLHIMKVHPAYPNLSVLYYRTWIRDPGRSML